MRRPPEQCRRLLDDGVEDLLRLGHLGRQFGDSTQRRVLVDQRAEVALGLASVIAVAATSAKPASRSSTSVPIGSACDMAVRIPHSCPSTLIGDPHPARHPQGSHPGHPWIGQDVVALDPCPEARCGTPASTSPSGIWGARSPTAQGWRTVVHRNDLGDATGFVLEQRREVGIEEDDGFGDDRVEHVGERQRRGPRARRPDARRSARSRDPGRRPARPPAADRRGARVNARAPRR